MEGTRPWRCVHRKAEFEQQIVAAAGKKESVSLSLFIEMKNLQVDEDLSTMVTFFWAEDVRMNRWHGHNGTLCCLRTTWR